MPKVVIASQNRGKLIEVEALLSPLDWEIAECPLDGLQEVETASTFVENALLKARFAAAKTGLPALADDSGLCIDALQGEPGVLSARYAGEARSFDDNIQKVLTKLSGIPEEKRTAYFICVLVLVRSPEDPTPIICEGRWHGRITSKPSGQKGFGYDPIFYVPAHGRTAAELEASEKNKISHRGLAFQKLFELLS